MNIPDSEVDKLIAEADYNNDDKIDYNEFLEMMKRDLKGEATEEAVKREASIKKQTTVWDSQTMGVVLVYSLSRKNMQKEAARKQDVRAAHGGREKNES